MIDLTSFNVIQGAVYGTAFAVNYLKNSDVNAADTFAREVLANQTINTPTNAYEVIFNYLSSVNNPFNGTMYSVHLPTLGGTIARVVSSISDTIDTCTANDTVIISIIAVSQSFNVITDNTIKILDIINFLNETFYITLNVNSILQDVVDSCNIASISAYNAARYDPMNDSYMPVQMQTLSLLTANFTTTAIASASTTATNYFSLFQAQASAEKSLETVKREKTQTQLSTTLTLSVGSATSLALLISSLIVKDKPKINTKRNIAIAAAVTTVATAALGIILNYTL